jgi:hypothetical protein
MSTKMNTKKSTAVSAGRLSGDSLTKTTPPVVDTLVNDTPVVSCGSNAASSFIAPLPSISFETILAALRTATPEQLSDFLEVAHGGYGVWSAKNGPIESAPTAKVPKTKAVVPKPKKEKVASAPIPFPEDGTVPTAASYRLIPSDIDHSTCVARVMKDGVDDDKRWKPAVYREHQCGGDLVEGSDLCSGCNKRAEKAAETGKHGAWNGRVSEDPPSWCHMLGTAWAAKCKWNPEGSSVSDSASVASDQSSTADKMNAAAAKKEAAAKKAEEKAAAAAKKAEEKAAAAAKKAEEKAAAAAKPKAKAAAKPKKETPVSTSNAVADTTAPVATADGELEIIGHTMYWVRSGNVYEYDEESKAAGSFVGRKNEDGSIDEDADEEVDAESDSE